MPVINGVPTNWFTKEDYHDKQETLRNPDPAFSRSGVKPSCQMLQFDLERNLCLFQSGLHRSHLGYQSGGVCPRAQTGLIVFDGKGRVTFGTFTVATTTAGGGIQRGTFTGTYSVNGDCTGTSLTDLGDGTVFHFDLVIQGPSRYTAINTDPGAFMSVYSARKVAVGQQEPAMQ